MFWNQFTQMQQIGDFWAKAAREHVARMESFQKEMEKLEEQGQARLVEAIDESAKLAKAQIAYAQKLQAEWRRVGAEAVRKSTEPFGTSL